MRHVLRKVVIVGGSGFVGRAVADRFRMSGRFRVQVYGSKNLDLTRKDAWKHLKASLDRRAILVIAARSRKGKNSADGFLQDVAIAGNVACAIRKRAVKKCIYLSSASVYGDLKTNLRITEKTPVRPSSLYGAAKLAGEEILQRASKECGSALLVLRPCMVYGPRSRDQEAYGPMKFANSIKKNGRVLFFGDGGERRDYVFIEDFADIVYRFSLGDHQGTFNVATGKGVSFKKLADEFQALLKQKIRRVSLKRKIPKSSLGFNVAKMAKQLGPIRFTPLRNGLKALLYSDVKLSRS